MSIRQRWSAWRCDVSRSYESPLMSSQPATCTMGQFIASDHYICHYRCYDPTGPAKADLVFLHGIQSHGGWYEYSCGKLRDAGYTVWFLDRRGSGLNHA